MVVKIMMMMPAGDNSWLVHQSSLAVLPAETSRRNGRRRENFAYQYLTHLKGSTTRRKILRNATSSVTSHTNEGLLRIFISLKNPSLWWTNQELSPVDIISPSQFRDVVTPHWHDHHDQQQTGNLLKFRVFWDVAPCRLVEVDRSFRDVYCLHYHYDRPDVGGSTHFWNVGKLQRVYTALHPRRL
jgi:hypothetical protein